MHKSSPTVVRAYLRAEPDVECRYGELKQRLAAQFSNNCVFGKTDFVLEVLRGAGVIEAQLTSIERVNRRIRAAD
jgi:hypothetical protein